MLDIHLKRGLFPLDIVVAGLVTGGIDPVIRGLVGRPAKLGVQEHLMVDAVRDRLFEFVSHMAQDLASLNMQRGRDHGVPGTVPLKAFCFPRLLPLCSLDSVHLYKTVSFFTSDCQEGSGLTQYNSIFTHKETDGTDYFTICNQDGALPTRF